MSVVGFLEDRAYSLASLISSLQFLEEQGTLSVEDWHCLKSSQRDYLQVLRQIEIKWAQKARLQWIINGDNNTKFFHTETKIRRNQNFIMSIEDAMGNPISESSHILNESMSFFFFSKSVEYLIKCLVDAIPALPKLISDIDNAMLIQIPSKEDIKKIVRALPNHKSPGPDGFGPSFYRSSWEIIKEDLVGNIQKFFRTGNLPPL